MNLEWTDSWSVGVPRLDLEHQHLIQLINDLRRTHHPDASPNEIQEHIHSVVAELTAYAENHFRFEESLMAEAGFPDLRSHRASHLRFRVQLSTLALNAHCEERDLLDLYGFLAGWIRFHVLESDQQYSPYLRAVGQ